MIKNSFNIKDTYLMLRLPVIKFNDVFPDLKNSFKFKSPSPPQGALNSFKGHHKSQMKG